MRGEPIQQHRDRFVEQDTFLHAVLGLLSYGRHFEATLTTLASDSRAASKPNHIVCGGRPSGGPLDSRRDGAGEAPDAPALLLLGALGFWQRIRAVLEGWAEGAGHETGRALERRPASPGSSRGSLLR